MKKGYIVALVFFLTAVAFGCAIEEKQPESEFRESESVTAAADTGDYDQLLKELQREIGVLIGDARPIGPDHFQKLTERVQQLAGKGLPDKELDELERKLETLNPGGQTEADASSQQQPGSETGHNAQGSELEALKREIDALAQTGMPTGDDRYISLGERLTKLEALDVDIGDLREKLETVKPRETIKPNESLKFKEFDRETLPGCEGKLFTAAPTDLNKIYDISPLGSIGPPGHTFPTEHTYWQISPTGQTTATIDLYAPGDMYILTVDSTQGPDPGYGMSFALCRDLHGYFKHVKDISGELKSALEGIKCEDWQSAGGSCTKRLSNYTVKAGTVIGKVGHLHGNFDFGVVDYRVTNKFANPSRYHSRTPNIVCPFEYFTPEIKSQIYAKVKRTVEPRCGTVMQDIAGTLQGNWFYGENATAETEWERHLAFVHDQDDTGKATISIAGIISEPTEWIFSPKSAGLIDREFSQVTSDGNTYCYNLASGRIVLKMTSATELAIEKQSESCGTAAELKPTSTAVDGAQSQQRLGSPTTYNR